MTPVTVAMATIAALLAAGGASLYAQLKDEKTLDAALAKLEAFQDQPRLLQGNVIALGMLSGALLVKVNKSRKRTG